VLNFAVAAAMISSPVTDFGAHSEQCMPCTDRKTAAVFE
jgi:hypothetical protein